jgi:hypothetical protein
VLPDNRGTVVLWRVRCGLCGSDDYQGTTGDLRRNKSCGCVPQGRWTGPRSDEFKAKVSASLKGKRSGADNPNWRGDEAGYYALHAYVNRHFEACPCENCGRTDGRLEWAQKHDATPTRERSGWLRLCVRCHRLYDENPLATGAYWAAHRTE